MGSLAGKLYGAFVINERHRHRYEFNNAYRDKFEKADFTSSGTSPDGNLVVYDADRKPVWASNTVPHEGSRLVVQDDGNVVIYDTGNVPLWATNTPQMPDANDQTAFELVRAC